MTEEFKIQGSGRTVYLFTSNIMPIIARLRTQRQAAQAGKEIDAAVRKAIEDVLARYPEVPDGKA